jgi:hypothetical protein
MIEFADDRASVLLSCAEAKRLCRTECASARGTDIPFVVPANDNDRITDFFPLSAKHCTAN